jgi:hypothetical protein
MEWNSWLVEPALLLAAKMGSLPMVEILTQFDMVWGDSDSQCYFAAVVKSENPTLLRWWLGKLCDWRPDIRRPGTYRRGIQEYGLLAAAAFSTRSPEMFAVWEDFLLDPARQLRAASIPSSVVREVVLDRNPVTFNEVQALIPHFGKLSVVFSSAVFCAVKNDALLEARLLQTWHRLIDVVGPLDPRFLGWSLNMLSRSSSHSITMATELLRLGAPIDFPRGRGGAIGKVRLNAEELKSVDLSTSNDKGERVPRRRGKWYKGMTALHHAARATSEQAARFMRFLLEEGADPTYGWDKMTPAEEKGAALMQKWLGESWDEVVVRTKAARERRKEEDSEKSGDSLDEEEEEEELPKPKRRRKSRKI